MHRMADAPDSHADMAVYRVYPPGGIGLVAPSSVTMTLKNSKIPATVKTAADAGAAAMPPTIGAV